MTDEGRQFLEAALPAVAGLQRALEITRRTKDEIAGPLHIVGPRSVFTPVLWSLLDEFCRRHPQVQPDVELDDRVRNWVEDRVDVGFRIGTSPAEGVIARKLFPLALIICAAPAYLQQHGAPETLADLANHRCSAFRNSGTGKILPWYVQVDGSLVDLPVVPAMCFNDETIETQAVLAGHVIGLLSGVAATAHIRSGHLVPLLTKNIADRASVFIYYGSRASQPTRVRAFIDVAVEKLADNPAYVLTREELAAAERRGRREYSKRRKR